VKVKTFFWYIFRDEKKKRFNILACSDGPLIKEEISSRALTKKVLENKLLSTMDGESTYNNFHSHPKQLHSNI
jgi:hypothetical protein